MNTFYFVDVSMNSSNPSFLTSYKWIHLFLSMNSLITWIRGIFYIPWIHLLCDFIYYMIFTEFIQFMNSSICDFHWIHTICEFIYLHPLIFFFDSFLLSTFQTCLTWTIVPKKRVVLQKMMSTMITYIRLLVLVDLIHLMINRDKMMVSLNLSLLIYFLFPRIYRYWLKSWSSGHLHLLWEKEMWWLTFLQPLRECHLLFPKVHNNKCYPIQELSNGLTPAFSMGRILNLT